MPTLMGNTISENALVRRRVPEENRNKFNPTRKISLLPNGIVK